MEFEGSFDATWTCLHFFDVFCAWLAGRFRTTTLHHPRGSWRLVFRPGSRGLSRHTNKESTQVKHSNKKKERELCPAEAWKILKSHSRESKICFTVISVKVWSQAVKETRTCSCQTTWFVPWKRCWSVFGDASELEDWTDSERAAFSLAHSWGSGQSTNPHSTRLELWDVTAVSVVQTADSWNSAPWNLHWNPIEALTAFLDMKAKRFLAAWCRSGVWQGAIWCCHASPDGISSGRKMTCGKHQWWPSWK